VISGQGGSRPVAGHESPERAARLVEELTTAGFDPQAVERAGGVAYGRFTLVRIGGYTSMPDVERDLRRIRELPGGYSDARIVERQGKDGLR
jgi:hypothetical protein